MEPHKIKKFKTDSENSKITEQRTIKKIPAVTSVAACIRAETGVGPSIASGSQVCNPNCADLPIAAKNKKNETNVNALTDRPQTNKKIFFIKRK
jgi:hypothetical protein